MSEQSAAESNTQIGIGPNAVTVPNRITDSSNRAAYVPYQTDISGLSQSQQKAAAFIDSRRANAMLDTGNILLQRQMREALDHVFKGSPCPEFLTYHGGNLPIHDNRVIDGKELTVGPNELQPINTKEFTSAATIRGIPNDAAQDIAAIATAANLDQITSKIIQDCAVDLMAGKEADPQSYDDISLADQEQRLATLDKHYPGGIEKYNEDRNKITRWLATKTAPTGANLMAVMQNHKLDRTFLFNDPRVIIALTGAMQREGFTED
jgi:hypothetical protein